MNNLSKIQDLRIERSTPSGATQDSAPKRFNFVLLCCIFAAGVATTLLAVLVFGRDGLFTSRVPDPKVAQPQPKASAGLLDASGYIVARRSATVSSKVTGRVLTVPVEEGQYVSKGQVIATIDRSNLEAATAQATARAAEAQAAVQRADVSVEQLQRTRDRILALAARGFVSTQLKENAVADHHAAQAEALMARKRLASTRSDIAASRVNLEDTIVRAPFAGLLTVKAAQPGEVVSPISAGGGFTRTGIGTIVDMSSLEAEVEVSESYIGRIALNQPVQFIPNAYPDLRPVGCVITIIPAVDRSKATVTVRVALKQLDRRILPGMAVRAVFLPIKARGANGEPPGCGI